jgi:hypothetical protein
MKRTSGTSVIKTLISNIMYMDIPACGRLLCFISQHYTAP